MNLLSILAFAVSSSFDNVGVGVAYGMRGVCIPFLSNLVIAAMNGSGTLVSMLAGTSATRFLESGVSSVLGGSIMICTGVWVFIDWMRHPRRPGSIEEDMVERSRSLAGKSFPDMVWAIFRNPFITHPQCSGSMKAVETLLIGSGLTMTNLVTGLAAGMLGVDVAGLTVASFLSNLVAMQLGTSAGASRALRRLGHASGAISGVLLAGIGLAEMVF